MIKDNKLYGLLYKLLLIVGIPMPIIVVSTPWLSSQGIPDIAFQITIPLLMFIFFTIGLTMWRIRTKEGKTND